MPSSVGNIEFWEIDGISLAEYGWNVSSLSGRLNVPQLRGEDATYAYVDGEDFRPKIPGSRRLTLSMWVAGADRTTGATDNPMLRFNDNWNFLTRLFWTPASQLTLTRRWLRTDPDTGTPGIHTTTAMGQYQAGLEASMTGRTRATFDVELKLTDPFFYGDIRTATINKDATVAVVNRGDYTVAGRHLYVDFVGPLTNPLLTNSTPATDVVVGYNGTLAAGQTLTLDVRAFAATVDVLEAGATQGFNRVNLIRNSGTRAWMSLIRGSNTLTLTADAGTGNAVVRFRPPYL